jgi:large subunit ribosomal protein L30
MVDKFIEVKLVRSLIGRLKNHVQSAHVLGLRKINQVVKVKDTPENRGLINRINYLVQCQEL